MTDSLTYGQLTDSLRTLVAQNTNDRWPKQSPSTSKLDRRVSDQKAAKELANIIRRLWVVSTR